MPVLSFKQRFVAPILAGTKTSTARAKLPGKVVPGALCDAKVGPFRPAFAKLRIVEVVPKRTTELTPEDAKSDGFSSVAEMLATLQGIYGEIESLHVIRFILEANIQMKN